VRRLATGSSEGALEQALRTISSAIDSSTAAADRDALLRYTARNISRRMIVVVLTDEAPMTGETEPLLRRLTVQHDVLWLTVRDAAPVIRPGTGGMHRRDVDSDWPIPDFVHGDAEVMAELAAREAAHTAHREATLRQLEITHAEFGSQVSAVPTLLALLNRRSNARS